MFKLKDVNGTVHLTDRNWVAYQNTLCGKSSVLTDLDLIRDNSAVTCSICHNKRLEILGRK